MPAARTRSLVALLVLCVLTLGGPLALPAMGVSGRVTLKVHGFGSKVEPGKVYVSSASRFAPSATGLKGWQGWGLSKAIARGHLYDPPRDPADDGQVVPGTVVLKRVKSCHGHRHYKQIQFRYDGRSHDNWRIGLDCKGVATRVHGPNS